jgi:hypothetical protein
MTHDEAITEWLKNNKTKAKFFSLTKHSTTFIQQNGSKYQSR